MGGWFVNGRTEAHVKDVEVAVSHWWNHPKTERATSRTAGSENKRAQSMSDVPQQGTEAREACAGHAAAGLVPSGVAGPPTSGRRTTGWWMMTGSIALKSAEAQAEG